MPHFSRMLSELEQIERQSHINYSPRSPSPEARRPMPAATQQKGASKDVSTSINRKRGSGHLEQDRQEPKKPKSVFEENPKFSDKMIELCGTPAFFVELDKFIYLHREEYPDLFKGMSECDIRKLERDVGILQLKEEEELADDLKLKKNDYDDI